MQSQWKQRTLHTNPEKIYENSFSNLPSDPSDLVCRSGGKTTAASREVAEA